MGYLNFLQRDSGGIVHEYSVPAIDTGLAFEYLRPGLTAAQYEEIFAGVEPLTFAQLFQNFKGLSYGDVVRDYVSTVGLHIATTKVFLNGEGITTANIPGNNYNLTGNGFYDYYGIQPNFPQSFAYVTSYQNNSVVNVYLPDSDLDNITTYLSNGASTPFYIGIITNAGKRTAAFYPPPIDGYSTPFTTTTSFDYTAYQKYPSPPKESPYDPGGSSGPAGGGGSFGKDETSDDLLPDLPNGSTEANDSNTGMYTRYLVNASAMYPFSEWLWSDDLGLNVAKTVISLLYGSPADALISLVSYPFSLDNLVTLESRPVTWGNYKSPVTWNALSSNAVQIDWGTISIEEYWGNFLDYAPHTQIELYLPWGAGFVELDAGQVMNNTIRVISNIELAKGTCLHTVFNGSGSAIGSYSASVGKSLPLIASDYASKQVAMAGTAIGIAAGAAIGAGISAAQSAETTIHYKTGQTWGRRYMSSKTTSINPDRMQDNLRINMPNAVKPAIASATAMALNPAKMVRSGSFQEGSAGLGIQYPYIILSRPTQSVPDEYGHFYGYPSNLYRQIKFLRGYTEVGEIHLDNVTATDNELKELDAILKGGVLL